MSNVEHGDERDDWWHNSKPGWPLTVSDQSCKTELQVIYTLEKERILLHPFESKKSCDICIER
jgi:hypothetical protein